MKQMRIIQAVTLVAFVTVLASCGPSREYRDYSYYPRHNSASFSLIINPGPGIYANRYRSPEGYIYWRGYDDRYYLDRSYLGRVHYGRDEYNDWKRYYNRHGKRYDRD